MGDYLTIRLITAAFRRDFPQTPPSETFLVVHHQGDGAEVCGTDEDAPVCMDPVHWAQDIAVHREVPFVPQANIGFAFNRTTGRWYAFEQETVTDDGKRVANPLAETGPVLFVSRSRKAAAA